jgi:hypothetical protein
MLVRGIAPIVSAQIAIGVQKAVADFGDRITAMEVRVASLKDGVDGKAGEPGRDGKDADPSEVLAVKAELARLSDGLSTLSVKSLQPIQAIDKGFVEQFVKSELGPVMLEVIQLGDAIKALPTPKDGAPGIAGPAGPKGDPGERGPAPLG